MNHDLSARAGMRVIIGKQEEPFHNPDTGWTLRGTWPASWIGHPDVGLESGVVVAFRRQFHLASPLRVRIHVSADERYELFLDGLRLGRGPERGDLANWCYESYDLHFEPGDHSLVARTWRIGADHSSACAQFSLRSAFLLAAEGGAGDLLSTGQAPWECKRLGGYAFEWPYRHDLPFPGARVHLHAADLDHDVEQGGGNGWTPAIVAGPAVSAAEMEEQSLTTWLLRPAMLPPAVDEPASAPLCRHIQTLSPDADPALAPVRSTDHDEGAAPRWQAMLEGRGTVEIPPLSRRRVILDFAQYICGYPAMTVSGGTSAKIRVAWAESLYEKPNREGGLKGHRDQIDGKFFWGFADRFEPDGGAHRVFQPLWWSAGRYVEVLVETGREPLLLEQFGVHETHYPFTHEFRFESSDPRLAALIPMMTRTLTLCAHETYMDCPYYEQMMYTGDTRLEVLQTYALTADDRLPRKALLLFDLSRRPDGLTQSRYPSRITQIIPPFSLWWVAMVHDYWMWRRDDAFVRERLPGVRAVLEAFRTLMNSDDLLTAPQGWNFVDWVPGWKTGIPPQAKHGVSGILNLHWIYTLRLAAELEAGFGEPHLAARNEELATRVTAATHAAFWDEQRGLFADDTGHSHFSEHAQCLALLGGSVPEPLQPRVVEALLTAPDLSRATIYFAHYLFETYRKIGRTDLLLQRMELWFGLLSNGLRTTVEAPEPSRSDCHAWGGHPFFHYFSTLLGIRPAAPGFHTVRIVPQPGPLTHLAGTLPHPAGSISMTLTREGEGATAHVVLPDGVNGTLEWGGRVATLVPGPNPVYFPV